MKYTITIAILVILNTNSWAQSFASPQIAFNQAANEYIFDNAEKAVNTLNHALKDYPGDKKLRELLDKILKDRQQEQQQKQESKESEKNKENKEEEQKQEQGKSEEEKKQEQQNQESEKQEEDQKPQEQSQEKSDQDKKEEDAEKAQQAGEQEESDDDKKGDEQQIQQNLDDLNISPEKARMILEAMKNNEVQYIQQMRRKSNQKTDDGKPDW